MIILIDYFYTERKFCILSIFMIEDIYWKKTQ